MVKKSKSMSFEGYSLKVWAKHNKGNLRLVLSGCLGLVAMALSDLSAPWAVALGGLVTTGSKLALDAFDYWISEVSLD